MEPATFKLAQLCVESAECYTNQPVVQSIGQEEMEAAEYAESLIQYDDVKDHKRQPLEWYTEAQDRKFKLIAFLVGTIPAEAIEGPQFSSKHPPNTSPAPRSTPGLGLP